MLTAAPPILQFGTGRFLQAHVDLFVSQALASGAALGGIAVVQGTDNVQSSERLAALAQGNGYRVELRGLRDGERVNESVQVNSVHAAWHVERDWQTLRHAIGSDVRVVVSNTADHGYALHPTDTPRGLYDATHVPRSFPARLVSLLHHRWTRSPDAPLTLLPCELVSRNGDTLKGVVTTLARDWRAPEAFVEYLLQRCVWANTLVDRIVSEPLQPAGAVAEPYALWAIESQSGLVLPCEHPAIVLTDALGRFERLKLMLLNLGHTFLAQRWIEQRRPVGETVLQAMSDAPLRAELEAVWADEVLPLFDALGEGAQARSYLVPLRERLLNPFLAHRLFDIARDHEQKKLRRMAPVVEQAQAMGLGLAQPRLRACLGHDTDPSVTHQPKETP